MSDKEMIVENIRPYLPTIVWEVKKLKPADILGIYSSPIQLSSGIDVGMIPVITRCCLQTSIGTTPYDVNSGGSLILQYGNEPHGGGLLAAAEISSDILSGPYYYDKFLTTEGLGAKVDPMQLERVNGQSVFITNRDGAFTGGDTTLWVTINYFFIRLSQEDRT